MIRKPSANIETNHVNNRTLLPTQKHQVRLNRGPRFGTVTGSYFTANPPLRTVHKTRSPIRVMNSGSGVNTSPSFVSNSLTDSATQTLPQFQPQFPAKLSKIPIPFHRTTVSESFPHILAPFSSIKHHLQRIYFTFTVKCVHSHIKDARKKSEKGAKFDSFACWLVTVGRKSSRSAAEFAFFDSWLEAVRLVQCVVSFLNSLILWMRASNTKACRKKIWVV